VESGRIGTRDSFGFGAGLADYAELFIERGFRVTSDDLLHSWKDFIGAEEEQLRKAASSIESVDVTPAGRAARFVQANIQYPGSSFDAILLWDILDYLEPAVASRRSVA